MEQGAAKTSENSLQFKFVETLKGLFLFQHVKEPSRYRHGNEPSILDLVITNEEEISDLSHYPGLGKGDQENLSIRLVCKKKKKRKLDKLLLQK